MFRERLIMAQVGMACPALRLVDEPRTMSAPVDGRPRPTSDEFGTMAK